MNAEQKELYNQLEIFYKSFKPAAFSKSEDPNFGLASAEKPLEEIMRGARSFFRNKSYVSQLPNQQLTNVLNSLNNAQQVILSIDNQRDTDPTQFKSNRSGHIQSIDSIYNDLYLQLITPLRSYQAINRNSSLEQLSKAAEETLQRVEESEEAIEQVDDARREATADEAVSENARHFDQLAFRYNLSKDNWFKMFWLYIAIWLVVILFIYTISDTIKNSLKDFDPANVPAYILKIILVAVFAYGLNFISRNYNARLMLAVASETRSTRLKTWRAFVSTPELKSSEPEITKLKAEIVLEIAKVIFSDIPTSLDKGRSKIFETPISITRKD